MNNEVVAHRFIYGEKTSAKGSNFSFEYDRLYSYDSILAKINREKKNYIYRLKRIRILKYISKTYESFA